MESIKEDCKEFQRQIETMEKFIALSFRRDDILPQAYSLVKDVETVQNLMLSASELVANELGTLEEEHDKLMRRMRKQQAMIMDYLLKMKQQDIQDSEANNGRLENTQQSARKQQIALLENGSARKAIPGTVTPKMTIYDYKESPMVHRSRPNPLRLNFAEFETVVTEEMFRKVPKYMLGRESLQELNNFLESVIITCFNEKYQLLYRKRSTLRKPKEVELWILYTQQESYMTGKFFITAGDISRKIDKMIDKKLQNRITILRNVGILKEQRVSQTVCYIWTANNLM